MIPRGRPNPADGRWVPPGEAVEISGIDITDGMIYVGRGLPRVGRDGPEPSLIDPHQPVSAYEQPRWQGGELPNRPSYLTLTPARRLAYLRWLAGGRDGPDSGCAFLFFYGLERRILRDLAPDIAGSPEVPLLVAELCRLLRVYRHEPRLKSQIGGLLVWLRLHLRDAMGPPPTAQDLWGGMWEAVMLRMRMGALAVGKAPVPDWVARRVVEDLIGRRRSAADAVDDEYEAIFGGKFSARFPAGPFAVAGSASAEYEYRPASMALTQVEHVDLGVPEARLADEDWREIGWMIMETDEAVSALRKARRIPGGGSSLLQYAHMHPASIARLRDTKLAPLARSIEGILGHRSMAPIDLTQFAKLIRTTEQALLGKRERELASRLLSCLGYGLEPDPASASIRLRKPGTMVLLRVSEGARAAQTEGYGQLCEWVAMLVEVAVAAGHMGPRCEAELARQVDCLAQGDAALLPRLNAHMLWRMETRLPPQASTRAMGALDPAARASIARGLVAVATADGEVAPGAMKLLLKRYSALDMESTDLYADIHSATTGGADEPVTVIPAGPGASGFAISGRPPSRVKLDHDRIERTRKETEEAAATLLRIVVESEESPPAPPPPTQEPDGLLDRLHRDLLERLVTRPSWPLVGAEGLARDCGIGLAAAIDTINEAALDLVDEYAIEGDDPLQVNADVAKGLLT